MNSTKIQRLKKQSSYALGLVFAFIMSYIFASKDDSSTSLVVPTVFADVPHGVGGDDFGDDDGSDDDDGDGK